MHKNHCLAFSMALFMAMPGSVAASEVANAAMDRDINLIRSLLVEKAAETGLEIERLSEIFEYVNAPQTDGSTALHWAINYDDLAMADLLIGAGANVSASNRTGVTPMRLASINGSADMLKRLLDAGADPNAPLSDQGDTALMMAARTGLTQPIQLLLDRGADIDATESWGGTTALMWAISEHHPEAARALIEAGADLNLRSKIVGVSSRGGAEGNAPIDADPSSEPIGYALSLIHI